MLLKLLWVDDDEHLIDSSIPVFMKYGVQVLKATNTSRALKLIRNERLDGVLLDKRLSGDEDGLELLDELKHHYPNLKIALFTAFPEYDEQVKAKEKGAIAYLHKIDKSIPADPEKQKRFFQALKYIFTKSDSQEQDAISHRKEQSTNNTSTAFWSFGIILFIFLLLIFICISFLFERISITAFPIAIISCLLFYSVTGAFLLRARDDLSEKSFIKLMLECFKIVTLLRKKEKAEIQEKENKYMFDGELVNSESANTYKASRCQE